MIKVENTPSLNYSPRPPFSRSKYLRVLLIKVAAIGLLVSLVLRWGPPIYAQSHYLFVQSTCLRFNPPPDQVAYDDDPVRATALQTLREYSRLNPAENTAHEWANPARYVPRCFKEIDQTAFSVAFMHGLIPPNGEERLVVARAVLEQRDSSHVVGIMVTSYKPAGWKPGTKLTLQCSNAIAISSNDQHTPIRIFCGRPDRMQSNRFRIHFELDSQQKEIFAEVIDDSTIHLSISP